MYKLIIFVLLFVLILAQNQCDFTLQGSVCSNNGAYPIQSPSSQEGLRGFWDFEDVKLINSGQGSILEDEQSLFNQVTRGPSFIGDQNSAFFDGKAYIQLQHNQQEFKNHIWTYSFWIFMLRDGGGPQKSRKSCPIFQKGTDSLTSKTFQRQPALYFNQQSRVIELYIDQTTGDDSVEKIFLSSTARMQFNKWTLISIVNTGAKVKMYFNGILDSIQIFESLAKFNQSPLYIGAVPWLKDDCSLNSLIDKFSYYNIEVKAFQLQAIAQPAIGMVEGASIHLGCITCTLKQAKESCIKGYHLCTSMEIYSGVYNIIKSLGWLEWTPTLWTFNMLRDQLNQTGVGTSVCCVD